MSWSDLWKQIDAMHEAALKTRLPKQGSAVEVSADRNRTLKAEQRIKAGFHPINGRPLKGSETCATCAHCTHRESGARRTFYKCALWGDSRGPATDIPPEVAGLRAVEGEAMTSSLDPSLTAIRDVRNLLAVVEHAKYARSQLWRRDLSSTSAVYAQFTRFISHTESEIDARIAALEAT